MSELLRLEHVTRAFGGTVAVDGLSFTLPAGGVTSLIGPNGAGKTTVVALIAGVLQPDAGRILLRGEPLPAGAHAVARAGVGRLFQDVRIFPNLSLLDNVAAAVPNQRGEGLISALLAPRAVAAEEARAVAAARERLAFVGLADRAEALAGSLSYGQQKLVAIARLLALGSELLLLDEPASGVHPSLLATLAEVLGGVVAEGRTVLLVEHNMAFVREVSRDVLLLDRGCLRAHGPVEEVWASDVLREVYVA